MSKSQPTPPAPPDYAAANVAGVQADISTLPLRNAINAASQLGTKYVDPATGKEYDFTGLGSADLSRQQIQQQLEFAPDTARQLLNLQKELGGGFAEESRRQLQIVDPTGFALREQFGNRLANGENSIESLIGGLSASAPAYEQIGNGSALADTGAAASGRSMLESQIFDELAKNAGPDPTIQRAAEQAARARGASRGNILGDSSALQESLGVQQAQMALADQRRAAAGNLLASGQTTSDKANSLSDQNYQRVMSSINQRNQAKQNQFGDQQGLLQQKVQGRQQDLANLQSFLGLQPIVSQGGQLAGLQQGAAPFAAGNMNAIGVDANAGANGAQFANGVFGTQANIFSQQSQAASQGGILGTLGKVAGIASGLGSAYKSFCHVAREVYGDENPDWVLFYQWKEYVAPAWFRSLYNRYSRQVAAMIRPFPAVKAAIRRWMDSKTLCNQV